MLRIGFILDINWFILDINWIHECFGFQKCTKQISSQVCWDITWFFSSINVEGQPFPDPGGCRFGSLPPVLCVILDVMIMWSLSSSIAVVCGDLSGPKSVVHFRDITWLLVPSFGTSLLIHLLFQTIITYLQTHTHLFTQTSCSDNFRKQIQFKISITFK